MGAPVKANPTLKEGERCYMGGDVVLGVGDDDNNLEETIKYITQ